MLKNSLFYSIQLDESTDITNEALFICFVRFEYDGELCEELLCSLDLPVRTASKAIFKDLNGYFTDHGID